jgi:hypothetical protein
MADNLNKRRPLNSGRININQAYELRYWTTRFQVSDSKLRLAVKMVGIRVADVRKWLKAHPD